MARKRVQSKPLQTGLLSTPKDGCWIRYQLSLKGLNLTIMGDRLGVTQQAVGRVTAGKSRSKRIESAIAKTLGYHSFEEMLADARGKGNVA